MIEVVWGFWFTFRVQQQLALDEEVLDQLVVVDRLANGVAYLLFDKRFRRKRAEPELDHHRIDPSPGYVFDAGVVVEAHPRRGESRLQAEVHADRRREQQHAAAAGRPLCWLAPCHYKCSPGVNAERFRSEGWH